MSGAAGDLLRIEGLSVAFDGLRGPVAVLDAVSLGVAPGEVVGIVGESGSGKSVTSLAVMGLLGAQGRVTAGRVLFDGTDLLRLSAEAMRARRGRDLAMIFQEPGTSLNPVLPVGFQIAEVLIEHLGLGRAEAAARAVGLMDKVGIAAAARRAEDYPHQLSGGMKQRIMIAMALACRPRLLIADEPTTALDVTIQAQILTLIADLRAELGMAVLLITHDMGVIAQVADRVAVMYAGQIVEEAPVADLFASPAHPYTRLLLHAIPSARHRQGDLPVIAGTTPAPADLPAGCRFNPRCPIAADLCRTGPPPPLAAAGPGRRLRCLRPEAARGLLAAGLEALR
jgi:oligopeptide/dipeptide ABC transporter ATP-binding protein